MIPTIRGLSERLLTEGNRDINSATNDSDTMRMTPLIKGPLLFEM